ncbi:nuclear transport factor 2 family protein [Flavobacterium sp. 3HN19-14]|uniref:nuclear transport factor 2 family protein n=1 Tax=Flavobacterium sp. 3HN19-14 TaxID=3448133 RepID=UPI003EDFBCAC
MKKLIILIAIICCSNLNAQQKIEGETGEIVKVLNAWHKAAAEAKFDAYFKLMTSDAVFVGTDATEHWDLEAFKAFAKPYFDKGKAWNFTPLQRNIYTNESGDIAWFDELLDTQMKICRGSGILKKQNGKWKIAHYVLSIAIPNDQIDEVVKIKSAFDDNFIKSIGQK